MLETILLVALIGVVAGIALRAAGFAYADRVGALQHYYSLWFP